MKKLQGKTIVIGVTGGISCYKVLNLIKKLRKEKAKVHVIMTDSAQKLVSIKDFENASGNEVQTNLFNPKIDYHHYLKKNKPIKHISLADIADLFLICPATANVIAKAANGIADDLLTTSLLATSATVLFCPAMNVKMWKHPLTQENIKKLQKVRYEFVDPEYGMLACGYEGVGRLANLNNIIKRIETIVYRRNNLRGKKILVTAGATSEEIDPVRVITNKSSGKMGTYIAEEAFLRGAAVTLIKNAHSLPPKYHFKEIDITTAKELHTAIKKEAKKQDVIIHAAAVSDFTTKKTNGKIKSGQVLNLELEPTTKIFENIRKMNPKATLMGFKAEYKPTKKELIQRAYDLLKSAKADYVIANDIGQKNAGFDVDTNEVFIIDKKKKTNHVKLADKRIIANKILDLLK